MDAMTLEAPTEPPARAVRSERTRLLLEGPVLPTLLRLSAPTIALMTFQAVVNAAEAYFVGFLGSDALAAISLSFPLVMLMTTLSAGAYGGGVAAAVARAIGGGRREEAARLAGTALTIGALLGATFSVVILTFGREIFAGLGATGPVLDAAVEYSNVMFLGAVPFWVFQAAASCLRGSGNTSYPAVVGAIGGVVTLAVSPALIFGVGPLAGMGLIGAAWAVVGYNVVSAVLLIRALRTPGSPFRAAFEFLRPDRRRAAAILRVAVPSAFNTIQSNLTFLALTALVAPFGTTAIAGYGMGGRLEFLLIPIVFGVGSALVPLVGANAGAGNRTRVRQATRAGLVLGAGAGALVGLTAAALPIVWMGLFTTDPRVGAL
ncbi:multidrug transporter : Multidrug transporter MatE OS=Cupriavidus sp. SK-3 GN=CF70_018180 PE=4 SV=1: MatE: MatE [Gemmata massiliana]|uniref:MATE family efflux transporter n=1 Tax=Gemmata massiliana TaxID=1210884 RepID=A0A6P2D9J8_9BACT|nr:MATE family efflux transporter [Gemmata massiliana]VTR98021.1 multidrug transporter : Multidrug transporter MatE OS=Cupriavidus sp. SK-3 GN=CF70_018180 PE=4 SV=1: MatE: MatE [Gemmata massiliana]